MTIQTDFINEDILKIIDLYENKKFNLKYVGELFDVSRPVIKRILIENGIKIRKSPIINKRYEIIIKKCLYCNKEFRVRFNSNRKYCSRECSEYRIPYNKNKLNENEIIHKYINMKNSLRKLEKEYRTDRKRIKDILIKNNVEIRKNIGTDHFNYKGSNFRNYDVASRLWNNISKMIRKRDNFVCQKCGKVDFLHVHHIIPARFIDKEYKNKKENLITLCSKCHSNVEIIWWEYVEMFQNYLNRYLRYVNFYKDWIKYIPNRYFTME